jgi:LuxR family maltose regulon positive regulatory protein
MLVFDNLQDVNDDADFCELLREGLSRLPQGLNAFLISRHDPPPAFARMLANREMAVMGWEELRLTQREAAEIIRLRAPDTAVRKHLRDFQRAADGWAAGLVLLLEWARRERVQPQALHKATPDQILNYFGKEVFRKTDPSTQEFLLKTALLPRMTAKTAEALTGLPSAGTILERLSGRHTFTEKRFLAEPVYQYHPLFRGFLLSRGIQFLPPEALSALRRRAAVLLEAEGEVEAAEALLYESGDWEALIALIMKYALSLLAQGRQRALENWLNHLPADAIASSPWLQYWKGACLLPFDPSSARPFFERALEAFKERGDAAGTFLAWTGAADATVQGYEDFALLDRRIGELDDLIRTVGGFPSPEIEARVAATMAMALAFRQPWRPDLETWASRALAIQAPGAFGAHLQVWWTLSYYSLHVGDYGKAALAVDHLRQMAQSPDSPPLGRLHAIVVEACYYMMTGEHEANLKTTVDGLELARREGIHMFDHMLMGQAATSALNANDWRQARLWLERMEPLVSARLPFDAAFYHHLRAHEALVRGDPREALSHSDRSLKARALHALGRDEEAAECLTQAYDNAKRTANPFGQFRALALKAELSFDRGRDAHGLNMLRRALSLGSEGGYLSTFVEVPFSTARLYARALEAGIEVPYVQWVIRKRRLILEDPPYQLENWPWALKVYALGSFRLEKDGEPITFSGKVQQKPLLLLKALIALGGKDVREKQVSDALWPEAEGDAAHSAFTTTLSRLRDLLGVEQAIRVQEGRATLDAGYCWVDAWAFERLPGDALGRLKAVGQHPDRDDAGPPDPSSLVGKALALYRGHFLPSDEAHLWTTSYRERLRAEFIRLIGRWGEHLENVGQWKDAVNCYQRGLEVDELAEAVYQRLMCCYQELGLRGEAIAAYRRCRKVLSSVLGVDPSPKTEAIYRSLRT